MVGKKLFARGGTGESRTPLSKKKDGLILGITLKGGRGIRKSLDNMPIIPIAIFTSLPLLFCNSIYEYSHDQSDPAIAPDGKYVPRHHPIEYCDNYSHEITVMTQVTLKTIEQNDNVGMFSICFDGNSESEFEKFLMEFKDNATYNKDFNAIEKNMITDIESATFEI